MNEQILERVHGLLATAQTHLMIAEDSGTPAQCAKIENLISTLKCCSAVIQDESPSNRTYQLITMVIANAFTEVEQHQKTLDARRKAKTTEKPWITELRNHPEWWDETGEVVSALLDEAGKNPPDIKNIYEQLRKLRR